METRATETTETNTTQVATSRSRTKVQQPRQPMREFGSRKNKSKDLRLSNRNSLSLRENLKEGR